MAASSGKIVSNSANSQPESKPAVPSEFVEENKTEPVMEPMLLEDYKEGASPPSVENLFKHLKQEGIIIDKNVTMVVFIYILMLESGFVPAEFENAHEYFTFGFHYRRLLLLTNSMPKNWRAGSVYSFSLIVPPFSQHVCKLTSICATDDLVINCCIQNLDEANFTVLLDPALYVVSVNNDGRIFQNLQSLSQRFKNAISNPCRNLIVETYSFRLLSLQGMPPEIFWAIVQYCDGETIKSLNETCKYFKELCVNIKFLLRNENLAVKHRIRQYCTKYLFMR